MSKDIVTNDELAFLAKRNKEMAVEEFLTDELKQKIEGYYKQALVEGIAEAHIAQTLDIAKANLVSMVTTPATEVLAGMESDEMMSFFYRSKNGKGAHLMLVSVAELKEIHENPNMEEMTEGFSDLPIHLYQKLSAVLGQEVEVELDSVEVATLSELENVKTFDLNQLTEMKQIQLVPSSEAFTLNVMHLSDVSYMEGAYKMLASQVEATEEKVSEVAGSSQATSTSQSDRTQEVPVGKHQVINEDIPTTDVYRPAFQSLEDVSPREKVSDLNLLSTVSLDVYAVLGKTKCSIQELLELNVGAVIELDKLVDEPIEIYANDKQLAEGELVVIDDNFGVKITRLMK